MYIYLLSVLFLASFAIGDNPTGSDEPETNLDYFTSCCTFQKSGGPEWKMDLPFPAPLQISCTIKSDACGQQIMDFFRDENSTVNLSALDGYFADPVYCSIPTLGPNEVFGGWNCTFYEYKPGNRRWFVSSCSAEAIVVSQVNFLEDFMTNKPLVTGSTLNFYYSSSSLLLPHLILAIAMICCLL